MQTLDRTINIATQVLVPDRQPYLNIRVPTLRGINGRDPLLTVPAVWTNDMLLPRWDNLSLFVGVAESDKDLHTWKAASRDLDVGIVLLAREDHCTVLSHGTHGSAPELSISYDGLPDELMRHREKLFLPSVLARKRGGQLSFADLDHVLTTDSLAAYSRHRGQLDTALKDALEHAIIAQVRSRPASRRVTKSKEDTYSIQAVVELAIAYLAARILSDKNFFANERLTLDHPQRLLKKTLERANGFFDRAYHKDLPNVADSALQELATYIGSSVTFALIDHSDVGRLYEKAVLAIQELLQTLNIPFVLKMLPDLQQHYTPVAVADLMLERLPLERLRPQERIIYDPASGSGSLLLAATKRLALMPDIEDNQRNSVLAKQIFGNDIDETARLITKVRYTLIQQIFAPAQFFPDPARITHLDYMTSDAWRLPLTPRVVVGNPPFGSGEGGKDRAAEFVTTVLDHLSENSQFAFILPDTFLTSRRYGWPEVRKALAEKSQLLETWRLPEGVVGLSAQQAVSVVLGVVQKPSLGSTLVARASVTRATRRATSELGFIGDRWLTSVAAGSEDWSSASTPVPSIGSPTIPLNFLFHACVGVQSKPGIGPVPEPLPDITTKPYWQRRWKAQGSLWADPDRVPRDQRYIRYSPEYLYRSNSKNEEVYDSKKILVSYGSNSATRDPLSVCFDDIGFCPDRNTICIVPNTELKDIPAEVKWPSQGWLALSPNDKLMWLLGILASDVAKELTMHNRAVRHLTLRNFHQFRLPARLDKKVIELVKQILEFDKDPGVLKTHVEERGHLMNKLNDVVRASYEMITAHEIQRTGQHTELAVREKERANRTFVVLGRVLNYDIPKQQIEVYLEGLPGEEQGERSSWIPLPAELPGWALDGTVFAADISRDVRLFSELSSRPWALSKFRHTPRPYMSLEELEQSYLSFFESTI